MTIAAFTTSTVGSLAIIQITAYTRQQNPVGGVLCFWGGANYKAYSCLHDCGERRSLLSAHAYVTFNEKKWLRMNGTQKTKKLKIKKKIYGEPSRLVWDERQLRGLPIWTILRSTDPLLLPFSHLVFIPYQVSHSERCSHIQRQK